MKQSSIGQSQTAPSAFTAAIFAFMPGPTDEKEESLLQSCQLVIAQFPLLSTGANNQTVCVTDSKQSYIVRASTLRRIQTVTITWERKGYMDKVDEVKEMIFQMRQFFEKYQNSYQPV